MELYEKPSGVVKPCPFCGKTEHLQIMNRAFFNKLMEENGRAKIDMCCYTCKLELSDYDHDGTGGDYAKRRARLVSKWNDRAESKAVSE